MRGVRILGGLQNAGTAPVQRLGRRLFSDEVAAESAQEIETHTGLMSGRVLNVSKYMLKSDLLWFLKVPNVTEDDMTIMYDSKYRPKFFQVNFDSLESFRMAQKSLATKGRFGGRYLKLTRDDGQIDEINRSLKDFRGRSLVMLNMSNLTSVDDIERFFHGYRLDTGYSVKFVRSVVEPMTLPYKRPMDTERHEVVLRALVRFHSQLEAVRALREKHGEFCSESAVSLRYIG